MAVLVATMEALLTPLWSIEQYRHSYCNVQTHPHEHVVQVEICSLRFISQVLHTCCLLSLAFPLDSSMLSLVIGSADGWYLWRQFSIAHSWLSPDMDWCCADHICYQGHTSCLDSDTEDDFDFIDELVGAQRLSLGAKKYGSAISS